MSREDQLAKELMLPRTQKTKQIIIKNESDSDEEIVIKCSEQIKQNKKTEKTERPVTALEKKKPKYIPQSKYDDLQDEIALVKKKRQVTKTNTNTRKGFINSQVPSN